MEPYRRDSVLNRKKGLNSFTSPVWQTPMSDTKLNATISLIKENKALLSHELIKLLDAIHSTGSITKASKCAGVSYRTAWNRIASLNNLSSQQIVSKSTGGPSGGGASLTDFGLEVLNGYHKIEQVHSEFVAQLGGSISSLQDLANFTGAEQRVTSARNQFLGTVSKLKVDSVNAVLDIRINARQVIQATITNQSLEDMQLESGSQVYALVKASWLKLEKVTFDDHLFPNQLDGRVVLIHRGTHQSEVILDIGEGKTVCAVVDNEKLERLGLSQADQAIVVFDSTSVILMSA